MPAVLTADRTAFRVEAEEHGGAWLQPPEIRDGRRDRHAAVLRLLHDVVERRGQPDLRLGVDRRCGTSPDSPSRKNGTPLQAVARQVEARQHGLDHVGRVRARPGPAAASPPACRSAGLSAPSCAAARPVQLVDVGEVRRVEHDLPVGADLHLRAAHRLVLERAAGDDRIQAHARHQRDDQQERHRAVRLGRDVPQRQSVRARRRSASAPAPSPAGSARAWTRAASPRRRGTAAGRGSRAAGRPSGTSGRRRGRRSRSRRSSRTGRRPRASTPAPAGRRTCIDACAALRSGHAHATPRAARSSSRTWTSRG